jgi:glycerol-1-phosphate dehydrogenase [NAD(P)+]
MTLAGSSAPASGGEHLLSHTLDMMAARDGVSHDLHGRQVGVGTVFSAALYERLMAMERLQPVPIPAGIDEAFWGSARLCRSVSEQWQEKKGELDKMGRLLSDPAKWEALKKQLLPVLRRPQKIKEWLTRAGAACTAEDISCPPERLRGALLHMHEIRRRCTVVDLAWVAGLMPRAADEIIEQWLVR